MSAVPEMGCDKLQIGLLLAFYQQYSGGNFPIKARYSKCMTVDLCSSSRGTSYLLAASRILK